MVDNVSYVQGLPPLVIIHHPHVSTASVSKGCGGLEGRIGLPAFASQYLVSLGLAWAERGMGALYIKYTWSIGNCASWCNIPAP